MAEDFQLDEAFDDIFRCGKASLIFVILINQEIKNFKVKINILNSNLILTKIKCFIVYFLRSIFHPS